MNLCPQCGSNNLEPVKFVASMLRELVQMLLVLEYSSNFDIVQQKVSFHCGDCGYVGEKAV